MSRTAVNILAPVLLAAVWLLVGGCRAPGPAAASPLAATLAADRRLPANDIAKFYPPEKWEHLRGLEYRAFVVMDGFVRSNGSLRITRIDECYPDSTWVPLARNYAAEVELGAASIGSSLPPAARLYVIFFKPGLDGNLALIFARQTGEPPPGMTGRAVYFHAARY